MIPVHNFCKHYAWILLYLTILTTVLSGRLMCRKALQCSRLFPVPLSRGPRILVQYIAVNNGFLLTIFKEDTRNVFLCLIDMRYIKLILFFLYIEVLQDKPAEAK